MHRAVGSGPSRPSGYLVWVRDGVLMAQPFDHQNVRLTGKPAALPEEVAFNTSGSTLAQISASADGTLLYSPARKPISQLSWLGRNGGLLGIIGQPDSWLRPRISRDGQRVAVDRL